MPSNSQKNSRLARRLRRQFYLGAQGCEPLAQAIEPAADPQEPAPAHHAHHPHSHKHAAVAELEKNVETLRDQLARTQAEFDNFRKRQRREELQRLELANQGLIEQLLPVVDNFNRALANPGDSVESLLSGIQMIHSQLSEVLRNSGLEKIEALGQPFDPNKHEAVSVENTEDVADGTVLDVFQDGYAIKGRLLRPAMVKVARKP